MNAPLKSRRSARLGGWGGAERNGVADGTGRYGTATSRETKARTGDDLAASHDWSADAPPNKHRSSPIIAEAP